MSSLVLASSLAEVPLGRGGGNRAPYAAAGFRPSRPFPLPNEYLPPVDFETGVQQQQYQPNQLDSFEVTKQRVDFAGQEVQSFPINEPQTEYGPPRQPGFVNTQGTTGNRRPFFGQRPGGRRPHAGRPFPGEQPFTPTPRPTQQPFQPNFPQTPQANFIPHRLPNPATDERFEPQQTYPDNQFPDQQQQQQHQPALQYGAPVNVDPRNAPSDEDQQQPLDSTDELQKQFALDALNAAVENYNRLQENNADKISQGQYFVVNPDNSIQKVQFTTKQNQQEENQNNFTAELKYTKVGQLQDPLYKYNADGQLVRIVKK